MTDRVRTLVVILEDDQRVGDGEWADLTTFEHPDRAVYIFGPEDGSIPTNVRGLCHRRVFIPTKHCMNLGSAVNTILYDRMLKRAQAGLDPVLPISDVLGVARPGGGWHEPKTALDFVED